MEKSITGIRWVYKWLDIGKDDRAIGFTFQQKFFSSSKLPDQLFAHLIYLKEYEKSFSDGKTHQK
jgi:hypothetical protein